MASDKKKWDVLVTDYATGEEYVVEERASAAADAAHALVRRWRDLGVVRSDAGMQLAAAWHDDGGGFCCCLGHGVGARDMTHRLVIRPSA
ncbi:hypothetical protein WMF38_57075 [Sorangium sp. So ce118]